VIAAVVLPQSSATEIATLAIPVQSKKKTPTKTLDIIKKQRYNTITIKSA
jgi:hypothetical protein